MVKLKKSAIVYKKGYANHRCDERVVIKLKLLPGTLMRRPLSFTGKNRASAAVVLSITGLHDRKKYRSAVPWARVYQPFFKYNVGELVTPLDGFHRSDEECAAGIHFFNSRKKAEDY